MVMNRLTNNIRGLCMMLVDDIMACSESKVQVEANLERWKYAIEKRIMKASRRRME